MNHKIYRYKTSLSGTGSTKFHINKLKSNPLFEAIINRDDQIFSLTIYGPKKDHARNNSKDIKFQLSKRAKNLGLIAPEIVNQATEDIYSSKMAERLVLIGLLQLQMQVSENNSKAEVTLVVREEGGLRVSECIDYYVFWRISCLAQALKMVINGNIKKLED